MKKIYHLGNCTTCQRIIKELQPLNNFELHDIKTDPITTAQLEEMAAMAGSYEQLFSRRAMLYKSRKLNERHLGEQEYKNLILDHYTFLKRPVIIVNDAIYVGNSKKVVAAAKEAIHS